MQTGYLCQWHIDFAETHLPDGTHVVIIVLTDDYSRYCLRCQVVPDMAAETAVQAIQATWQAELVTCYTHFRLPVSAGTVKQWFALVPLVVRDLLELHIHARRDAHQC